MLKNFKNGAKSIITKLFMTIFALSFLSWGANSYFMNTPKSIAITVNGEEVSVSELQKEYDFRKKEAERQFGGKISPEFLQTIRLGNRTVNTIITSKLTLSEARSLGFRASKKSLQEQIRNNGAFKDADGKFNKDAYKRSVEGYGYSIRGYEKVMAEDMQKAQLHELFSTTFNDKTYLENLYNFQNEKLSLRVLHINSDSIAPIEAPTPAEVKSFYNENVYRYLTDETRDFNALVLRASDLTDRIQVTEEEMHTVYDENPSSFAQEEERKARHILVDSNDKALDIIEQLDKGASFTALAKKYSKDAFTKNKGGNLGFFLKGDMVKSFSKAAYSMAVNSISEPIKSPFGYHIIQLLAIKKPVERTFEEVKIDIEDEIKVEKAEDLYYDILDDIEDQVSGGSHLTELAKELKLNMQSYAQVKAGSTAMTFSTDIMPVVYSTEKSVVSDTIEIEGQDTVSAFIEVTQITPQRELTIDEAHKRIITELKEVARQKMIGKKAETLLVERQNTDNLSTLAVKYNLTDNIEILSGIGRTGLAAPKWLKPLQVKLLFAMEKGEELKNILNTPTGVALVELISIDKDNATDEDIQFFKEKISSDIQDDLFAQYMLKKRLASNIDLNIPSIKSALGTSFVK